MMEVESRILWLILTWLVPCAVLGLESNKLLVILLGGVRWDREEMPSFRHLALKGVKTDYLEPVFPAMTIPNLYTIMTGLYPMSHGQTGDYMYDVDKGLTFHKMTNIQLDSNPVWWENGDPFWINVMRQKKRAYLYRWPGCDVFVHGIKPTFCKPIGDWQMSVDELRNSLNESLRLFTNDSADFIAIYYNGLEQSAYKWGHSARLSEHMMRVDEDIGNFQNVLEKTILPNDVRKRLSDIVNVIVISDHGTTDISPTRMLDMTSSLQALTSHIQHYLCDRTTLQIWPVDNSVEKVYSSLNTSQAHYTTSQIGHMPERWHYMGGPFIAPIVLLADQGYTFLTPEIPTFPTFAHDGKTKPHAGGSGYSNSIPDMRGIFYARGPHFKEGGKSPGFSSVHIYQIMCAILGIDMSSNDGSWAVVADMLVATHVPHRYNYSSHRNNLVTALIVLTLLFCLISGVCALWCRRESIQKWYQNRSIRWQPLHDGII